MDYGADFSMEEAARLVGGADRNFRGALDATFGAQRAALPADAATNAGEAAREDAEAEAAAEAGRKRKAEADSRAEEEAKRAKTEAEATKKAEADAEAAAAAQAVGARGDQAPPGQLVSALTAPPCELRLAPAGSGAPGVSAGAPVLVACSASPGNKKLPKHLVLAKWSENLSLSIRAEGGPAFELHPRSVVFSKEAPARLRIGKAFKDHYQSYGQIFGYQPFPVGSLPKALTPCAPGKEYRLDFRHAAFDGTREIVREAIEAARTAPGLQVVWMVKADAPNQWVKPYGVAIATTAQVHLAGAAEHYFVDGSPAA